METKWLHSTAKTPWQVGNIENSSLAANCRITKKKQTIFGFGGCFNELGWDALSSLSDEQRQNLLQSLFHLADGCGFNLSRIPLGGQRLCLELVQLQ